MSRFTLAAALALALMGSGCGQSDGGWNWLIREFTPEETPEVGLDPEVGDAPCRMLASLHSEPGEAAVTAAVFEHSPQSRVLVGYTQLAGRWSAPVPLSLGPNAELYATSDSVGASLIVVSELDTAERYSLRLLAQGVWSSLPLEPALLDVNQRPIPMVPLGPGRAAARVDEQQSQGMLSSARLFADGVWQPAGEGVLPEAFGVLLPGPGGALWRWQPVASSSGPSSSAILEWSGTGWTAVRTGLPLGFWPTSAYHSSAGSFLWAGGYETRVLRLGERDAVELPPLVGNGAASDFTVLRDGRPAILVAGVGTLQLFTFDGGQWNSGTAPLGATNSVRGVQLAAVGDELVAGWSEVYVQPNGNTTCSVRLEQLRP